MALRKVRLRFTKHEWAVVVRSWQQEPCECGEEPLSLTEEYVQEVVKRYPKCFKHYLGGQEEK